MSSWMRALESPNNCSASVLASSVLPTPVGPSKANVPMGRRGSFRSARERRRALHKARDGFALADDDLLHFRLRPGATAAFRPAPFLQAGCRSTSRPRAECLPRPPSRASPRGWRAIPSNRFEPFLGLLFLVPHGGGALKILVLDRAFLLGLDLLDVGLEPFDLRRAGHRANARARAGFVHHINGLVRQVAVGDVPVGELDRGFDGLVRELGLVVLLVFGTRTLEDQDRLRQRRELRP